MDNSKGKINIEEGWYEKLKDFFHTETWNGLSLFVKEEYKNKKVFPPPKEIFNAYNLCPFDKVKVVILGQDPYHNQGQAHGLSFSVKENIQSPPSLQNIFKEMKNDVNKQDANCSDLTYLAEQGVFLLNSILTVEAHKPQSHSGKGWEDFTDEAIKILSKEKQNLVFLLWGNYAKSKASLIDENKHLILQSVHPSPFSANNGFFGCKHFSKTNDYLQKHNIEPIKW